MLRIYHRKLLLSLLVFLFMFAVITIAALLHLKKGVALLGTGLEAATENWIIMVLSLLSLIKVVHEIWKLEHPHELE